MGEVEPFVCFDSIQKVGEFVQPAGGWIFWFWGLGEFVQSVGGWIKEGVLGLLFETIRPRLGEKLNQLVVGYFFRVLGPAPKRFQFLF